MQCFLQELASGGDEHLEEGCGEHDPMVGLSADDVKFVPAISDCISGTGGFIGDLGAEQEDDAISPETKEEKIN